MKKLVIGFMFLLSMSAFAQECASNVTALKTLVGNNGLPTDWMEKCEKNPYRLKIKDAKEGIIVQVTGEKGEIATLTTEICRKGSNYVANVKNIIWGEAAPGIIKGKNVNSLKLSLPYQSVMKVSVSLMTIEFNPTK